MQRIKGESAALGSLAMRHYPTALAGVEGVAGHLPLEWVAPHEVGAQGKSFPLSCCHNAVPKRKITDKFRLSANGIWCNITRTHLIIVERVVMKKRAVVLWFILLPACADMDQQKALQAQQQHNQIAMQKYIATTRACTAGKLTRKNAIDIVECTNNALITEATELNSPDTVIAYRYTADRLKIVTQYSEGKITEKECIAQIKERQAQWEEDKAKRKAQSQEAARQQAQIQQQQEQIQQQQSNAETLQLLGIMQASQPRYNPAPATNANCVRTGNTVNCMSY